MEITVAVISDPHCHHSSLQPAESLLITDADRSPSSHHPVEALLDLIRDRTLRADLLVMPGDLTNKVDRQGMLSGWDFIGQIGASLKVRSIIPTLGNHDVISTTATEDPFQLARRLHPEFPSIFEKAFVDFWARGFYIFEDHDFRILVLNSAASHTNAEFSKRGLVSDTQLADIRRALESTNAKAFQLAVCHHHPILHEDIGLGTNDVMVNGSLLIALLAEHGFHLLIHGHKHHPKLSYANASRVLPVLAAGSFAAGMKNGLASRTRNVFHLITLRQQTNDAGIVNGIIHTWQFRHSKGWTPSTWDAADFPCKTGFGCLDTPEALARKVETAFRAKAVQVCNWNEVGPSVPEIQFVPPATFEAVGRCLVIAGIELNPPPPDEPKHIGVPT